MLQPGGDVHGIAGHERLAGARDDLAGVNADAHLQAERCDGIAHLDRRSHRAKGVVLVDLWEAEDSHRRIADELLDRATVSLEDRAKFRVVARHELAQRLRIGPLAERRRSDRSQNTTVTVLRTSAAGSTSNGDPHAEQNRAASAFSRPQEGQIAPKPPSLR